MGSTRRETTQDNVVRKAELEHFKAMMRSEAIADRHAWFVVSLLFGLRIKYTSKPLKTDLRVGIPGFGARIMPSGSGVRRPVGSIRGTRPDYHGIEIPTIAANAFNCGHSASLYTGTSVLARVIFCYKYLYAS